MRVLISCVSVTLTREGRESKIPIISRTSNVHHPFSYILAAQYSFIRREAGKLEQKMGLFDKGTYRPRPAGQICNYCENSCQRVGTKIVLLRNLFPPAYEQLSRVTSPTYHNLRLEELGYVEGDGEGDDGDDVLEQSLPQCPRAGHGLVVVCREGGGEVCLLASTRHMDVMVAGWI